MRRFPAAWFAILTLLLEASPARAQAGALEQAKTFFDAGAEAYEVGNFPAAIQAFESAYKLAPRPGIVFSMAQAHRRQYYIDKRPDHLRAAIKYYREYVGRVEQGGRRGEAAQALAELEPMAERIEKTPEPSKPPSEATPATRLMILSKVRGASISVDGARVVEMPLFAEVKPGKHTLHVSAEGYFPEDREVEALSGLVVTLDVPLREMPGRLALSGADGAQVTIDERSTGVLPLPKPLDVTAGRHLVAVTKSGYKVFAEEIEIERGQSRSLSVKLEMTGQRIGSFVLFGASAAGFITCGVLGLLAGGQQRAAQEISDRATKQGGAPESDLGKYNNAVGARDDLRRYAGVAAATGAIVGATGFLFFMFDQPIVNAARPRGVEKPKTPAPSAPRETQIEMSAAPTFGPGLYGASLTGRF
jgi:hypothetical protein